MRDGLEIPAALNISVFVLFFFLASHFRLVEAGKPGQHYFSNICVSLVLFVSVVIADLMSSLLSAAMQWLRQRMQFQNSNIPDFELVWRQFACVRFSSGVSVGPFKSNANYRIITAQ